MKLTRKKSELKFNEFHFSTILRYFFGADLSQKRFSSSKRADSLLLSKCSVMRKSEIEKCRLS